MVLASALAYFFQTCSGTTYDQAGTVGPLVGVGDFHTRVRSSGVSKVVPSGKYPLK
ncbi:unannotated protein [freshwater metagenome]|uniref:Unannotated protein n=1 Tax=freshwater metagenome TaxID=449393 RepID=A0A6J7P142_9ZZZZ